MALTIRVMLISAAVIFELGSGFSVVTVSVVPVSSLVEVSTSGAILLPMFVVVASSLHVNFVLVISAFLLISVDFGDSISVVSVKPDVVAVPSSVMINEISLVVILFCWLAPSCNKPTTRQTMTCFIILCQQLMGECLFILLCSVF